MMSEMTAEEWNLWLLYFQQRQERKNDDMMSPDEFLKGFNASVVGHKSEA